MTDLWMSVLRTLLQQQSPPTTPSVQSSSSPIARMVRKLSARRRYQPAAASPRVNRMRNDDADAIMLSMSTAAVDASRSNAFDTPPKSPFGQAASRTVSGASKSARSARLASSAFAKLGRLRMLMATAAPGRLMKKKSCPSLLTANNMIVDDEMSISSNAPQAGDDERFFMFDVVLPEHIVVCRNKLNANATGMSAV